MTPWRVAIDPVARKELGKLASGDRIRIARFIDEKLLASNDPRRFGHALTAKFAGLWSYRVGELRMIASIKDASLTVLVLRIGNRRDVYR